MSSSASWPGETQAPSAPCNPLPRRAAVRTLAVAGALLLGPIWPSPTAQATAVPASTPSGVPEAGEQALRRAVEQPSREARLAALGAVATEHAGTPTGGLARAAAGLELLEAGGRAEAIALLRHEDVQRTAVVDRALAALGSAYAADRQWAAAARAYLELVASHPESPYLCSALYEGGDALAAAGRGDEAVPLLERMLKECAGRQPEALMRLGSIHERRGDRRAAAAAYFRLEGEHPAADEARAASARLKALASFAPTLAAGERDARDLARARALSAASRYKDALPIAEALIRRSLPADQAGAARVIAGRALIERDRDRQADPVLAGVPVGSAFAPEAAFLRARIANRRGGRPDVYEGIVARYPGTSWAEEALVTMAHLTSRDGREEEAVPYYRRLLEAFPAGRYVERSMWAVGWSDYKAGRYAEAAEQWEAAAGRTPLGSYESRFLYWAGRARTALGQPELARALYLETVRRFKHLYHGLRAAEALDIVRTGASSTHPAMPPPRPGAIPVAEPARTRVAQWLLIDRFGEAADELRNGPATAPVLATLAWLDWRRGALRPAINALRRAYPEWMSADGDAMPEPAWRILYPVDFEEQLVASARQEGLDPALLAAIIWQESTFDPKAVSAVGARGLMQIMPSTGRSLARVVGVRYREGTLFEPEMGLRLGARYFRRMLDAFGGRVERALAAYNAGPGRAGVWSSARPAATAEEFIEGIPYPETRGYVMGILAHREHYRRLYGLSERTGLAPVSTEAGSR
jgi:peptidoglycan lytic transglycosylase